MIRLISCKWKGNLTCLKTQPFGINKVNENRTFFVEKAYFDFVRDNSEMEYELVNTYYQKNTTIIKPLIDMYYTKRKECKDEMKEMERMGETKRDRYKDLDDQQEGLKLLMNSLYGKMCESGHQTGIVYYESRYKKYTNEHLDHPCILTGSFITYRGRLSLLEKIKAILDAGHDFLYADTDSVVLGCAKDADMTSIFGVDKGNLGEWKQEGVYDLYLSLGKKKKYALINRNNADLKIKGQKDKLALSGIIRRIQDAIKKQLRENPVQTVDDLIFIFDPRNNVLFERSKPVRVPNHSFNQLIMYETGFQMNRDAGKPNSRFYLAGSGYVLEQWSPE